MKPRVQGESEWPDFMSEPERISAGLCTATFGRTVRCFDEVDSTNRVASELGGKGAPEGTLVIAERQTAGRGRRGRQWDSPPGVGIWCSIVLRPCLPCDTEWAITAAASAGAAAAIRDVTGLEARLKWPNDILIADRKVCGVLTEARLAAGPMHSRQPVISFAVVGLGINVNQAPADFAPLLRFSATSLKIALRGQAVDRLSLLQRMLEKIERNYGDLRACGPETIRTRWRELSCTIGRHVTIDTGSGVVHGLAMDVRPDGCLLVRDEGGGLSIIRSGEAVGR